MLIEIIKIKNSKFYSKFKNYKLLMINLKMKSNLLDFINYDIMMI